MKKDKSKSTSVKCDSNTLYGLGLLGAAVFYVQQAEGFWPSVVAILKALVWPAFVVYDLLKFLAG